jgi:hypothetical protein
MCVRVLVCMRASACSSLCCISSVLSVCLFRMILSSDSLPPHYWRWTDIRHKSRIIVASCPAVSLNLTYRVVIWAVSVASSHPTYLVPRCHNFVVGDMMWLRVEIPSAEEWYISRTICYCYSQVHELWCISWESLWAILASWCCPVLS